MKKTTVIFFGFLLLLVLLLVFTNDRRENFWLVYIPLSEGEKLVMSDIRPFTLKNVLFSEDGTRFAFSYHEIKNASESRPLQMFPRAEATSESFPSTNFLILDGQTIASNEGTANTTMYNFGFLNDNTFWYQTGKYYYKPFNQLSIEGIELPSHDVSYVYRYEGGTYFVIDSYTGNYVDKDSSKRHFYRDSREVSAIDLIENGLSFLTEINFDSNGVRTGKSVEDFGSVPHSNNTSKSSSGEQYVTIEVKNFDSQSDYFGTGYTIMIDGMEHKTYHYIYRDSLTITDDNILKFAAILNEDLVFVEVLLN